MARPELPRALITGASRGIGLAIAEALAPDHALILVARDEQALAENETRLSSIAAGEVRTFACDLSHVPSRRELIDTVGKLGVHVLVNNAGVAKSAPIERTDDNAWELSLALNLTAPFELCRALVPWMAASGWGRIVNLASTAALKGYRYTTAYSASKTGLLGLTRALALDVASKGVTVNAVCPGFTDTAVVADAVDNIVRKTGKTEADARASLAGFSPQKRLMTPGEVAKLVAYLVSEDAAGINGQALAIDGGETA